MSSSTSSAIRKLGHNEQDEPMVTQPLMYKKMQQHPGTRKLYADKLVAEGVLPATGPDELIADYRDHLDRGELLYNPVLAGYKHPMTIDWTPFLPPQVHRKLRYQGAGRRTAAPVRAIGDHSGELHPAQPRQEDHRRPSPDGRRQAADRLGHGREPGLCLAAGFRLRRSYFRRGRRSQHLLPPARRAARPESRALGHGTYYPLANLQERQGSFQCFDSVLSEEAVLAFEYGYSTANPHELVVWEAQFGDFANGAQVVIDQFIASGEAKWGRASGLVLLLPHGYEGQGPEHSSARIERYMQLCAPR
jgi:2-oxoglutarate dehydrogenase E1 component